MKRGVTAKVDQGMYNGLSDSGRCADIPVAMAIEQDRPMKLAVLIDADNASPRIAAGLFEEIASIGEASVRRIYGNFAMPQLKAWSDLLAKFAIIPHQNFSNTVGKNASDIALVIDAMDLLHTGRFDGFCLVSSDSDFTRLAARIREQGVDVFGFGEQKTPESFRQACKRFIYTENLTTEPVVLPAVVIAPPVDKAPAAKVPPPKQCAASGKPVAKPQDAGKLPPSAAVPLIRKALKQLDEGDGWYELALVGSRLIILQPDFDSRNYGCAKLVTLMEKCGAYEVRRVDKRVSIRPMGKKEAA